MCFQLQPFSRLMSSSFSVRSSRFMSGLLSGGESGTGPGYPGLSLLLDVRGDRQPGLADMYRRHVAWIVALRFGGKGLAARHQEIDDVVAQRIIERMAVK